MSDRITREQLRRDTMVSAERLYEVQLELDRLKQDIEPLLRAAEKAAAGYPVQHTVVIELHHALATFRQQHPKERSE